MARHHRLRLRFNICVNFGYFDEGQRCLNICKLHITGNLEKKNLKPPRDNFQSCDTGITQQTRHTVQTEFMCTDAGNRPVTYP